MTTTLVIGASGTVGSEVARGLAARGHSVRRATSRAPSATDQVQLDLAAGAGIEAAFRGAERLFVLCPPGFANQEALLAPAIDAATAHGLEQVVMMTAMGANADAQAPMAKAEARLQSSGLRHTIIRPNWFMQNFHTFWLHGIQTASTIALPVGTAKGSFIDARDIAAVAVELLNRHDLDGQAFDLTGAEALDHDQVAAILSQVTGRAIRFQDITPEAMRAGLVGAGLPPDYADFLVLILGFFKQGYSERITDAVQQITGQAPRRFADYAREHRAAWA